MIQWEFFFFDDSSPLYLHRSSKFFSIRICWSSLKLQTSALLINNITIGNMGRVSIRFAIHRKTCSMKVTSNWIHKSFQNLINCYLKWNPISFVFIYSSFFSSLILGNILSNSNSSVSVNDLILLLLFLDFAFLRCISK